MPDGEWPTTGALVWRLAMRWRAEVDRAVAPLGLTQAQYSALSTLWGLTRRGETPSQRRLAATTALGPVYVSKLVRSLEASGFVSRQPDPADARAVRLALTDRGTDVVERAMPVVRDLDARLTSPLGGPGSPGIRDLTAALQTLFDATPQTGDTT